MTYLVLVRHGESIWHALWTKEPVLLWSISADGCCGPRPAGTAGQSVVGIMAVVVAPAVGRVPARLGAAGVVVAAVAVMILAGLVIPVVHQRPGDERHGT